MRDAFGRIQKALVVGGSSDIAAEIIRALNPREVALAGRDSSRLAAAASEFAASVHSFECSDPQAVSEAVGGALAGADTDVAIIALGTLAPLDLDRGDVETLRELFDVNMTAASLALLSTARRLAAQGHGHLVVLSSIAAVRPRPSNYAYGAAKGGLDFFARGLRRELESRGVSSTIIRAGFVWTSMTEGMKPAPFAIDARAIARAAVVEVAAGRSGVVYVPGVLKLVSAAIAMMPDRLLVALDRRTGQ